jgi:hypothetical protein
MHRMGIRDKGAQGCVQTHCQLIRRAGERERKNTENTKRYETVIPLGVSSCGEGHPKAIVPPV